MMFTRNPTVLEQLGTQKERQTQQWAQREQLIRETKAGQPSQTTKVRRSGIAYRSTEILLMFWTALFRS